MNNEIITEFDAMRAEIAQVTEEPIGGRTPIVDLTGSIDWSHPQPEGTYRCELGWESGGAQFGCLERATTTDDDGQLLCTEHAIIAELRSIRQTLERQNDDSQEILREITDSLLAISWRARPWWARAWFVFRTWASKATKVKE